MEASQISGQSPVLVCATPLDKLTSYN